MRPSALRGRGRGCAGTTSAPRAASPPPRGCGSRGSAPSAGAPGDPPPLPSLDSQIPAQRQRGRLPSPSRRRLVVMLFTSQAVQSPCSWKVFSSVHRELREGRGLGWGHVAHFGGLDEGMSRGRGASSLCLLLSTGPNRSPRAPRRVPPALGVQPAPRSSHCPSYGVFAGGAAEGTT